ncbi:MAG: adenylosuccinate synthetase, partial [Bacteroidales bacterium]|nr:adenylosuccinate synthetase [Bacteroidales bacterium]
MKIDVLLGLQWGDEGKGKIVDVLAPKYDIVTRFQGGPNAGHTLKFNGKKYVLHTIPSGIFTDGAINIVGNGVVLDPGIFKAEIEQVKAENPDIYKCLKISRRANLILPTHRILDAANEAAKGKSKIGSTLKGIGPTYTDKISRNGLRIGDILSPEFQARYDALKQKGYNPINQIVGYILSEDPTYITTYNNARSLVRKLDRDELLDRYRRQGERRIGGCGYRLQCGCGGQTQLGNAPL